MCDINGDMPLQIHFEKKAHTSDNFSFQNNGIKKCTCWKTMGFFMENNGFFLKKSNGFDTTLHMIYFDYNA